MGTGEVVRYLGAYGSARVAKAALVSPIPPFLLRTDEDPGGLPADLIAQFTEAAKGDTPVWMKAFLENFYNYVLLGGTLVSGQAFQASWNIATAASAVAAVACIATWETDFRNDLSKIEVPLLVVQGDADRVLPFPYTGKRLAGAIADLELVVIEDGPHGIPWTHSGRITSALLQFAGASARVAA
jgi:non-heme chloroperoxidase